MQDIIESKDADRCPSCYAPLVKGECAECRAQAEPYIPEPRERVSTIREPRNILDLLDHQGFRPARRYE